MPNQAANEESVWSVENVKNVGLSLGGVASA